jgi:hypothetical protein
MQDLTMQAAKTAPVLKIPVNSVTWKNNEVSSCPGVKPADTF